MSFALGSRYTPRTAALPRLLLALVLVLASRIVMAAPALAAKPAPDSATAKFEVSFMEGMIDHHAMAVETGEICLEKAVHEELRSLCEQIIATQSREIETMQSWLADWYGVSYAPRMSRGDQRELERLASLSGAEFEIAFMEMMIEHHEAAIREAEKCVDRAYHNQLVRLCESIIAAQSAEIEQMQAWLCEWYGRCED